MRNARSVLMAATALSVMAGLGAAQAAMPAPRKGSSRDFTDADIERAFSSNAPLPAGPEAQQRAALAREIAEHNAEVERRKAAKKVERAHGIGSKP